MQIDGIGAPAGCPDGVVNSKGKASLVGARVLASPFTAKPLVLY
jgi:hypothetical protein